MIQNAKFSGYYFYMNANIFLYERKHMERFSNRAARHDSKNPKQRRMDQQKTGNSKRRMGQQKTGNSKRRMEQQKTGNSTA